MLARQQQQDEGRTGGKTSNIPNLGVLFLASPREDSMQACGMQMKRGALRFEPKAFIPGTRRRIRGAY